MLGDTFLSLPHKFGQDRGVVVLAHQLKKFFLGERQHLAVVERNNV